MTGRKRQKFEAIPSYSSLVLGMHFDFVGDFSTPHLQSNIEGSHGKRNFIVRYQRGETLVAAVLCNRKSEDLHKLPRANSDQITLID